MDNFFKSSSILKSILTWKWHLLIIMSAAILLSTMFSGPYFIKPKYKSYAIIYPSNIAPYSTENNTEQMLQLFNSEDLLLDIVNQFKLYIEYNIDTTAKNYRTSIIQQLKENLSVKKMEYESVLIEIYDENPIQACDMVKEFINRMNFKARQLQRGKTAEVVKLLNNELMDKRQQIDTIESRMQFLRKEYNILDYDIQVKEYSKGYVKSISGGHGNAKNDISNTLDNLKQYGGEYRLLDSYLAGLITGYNEVKKDYDKSVSDLNKELTYANIVTNPVPADRKSYPVRWLIVTITTISSVVLSLMLFSLLGARRKKQGHITQ